MNMKLNSVNNQYKPSFSASPEKEAKKLKKQQEQDKVIADFKEELNKKGIKTKLTPLQAGLMNGIFVFIAGFGIDRLLGKMSDMFKLPKKQSLIINGALGVAFGALSAYQTHKNNKSEPS